MLNLTFDGRINVLFLTLTCVMLFLTLTCVILFDTLAVHTTAASLPPLKRQRVSNKLGYSAVPLPGSSLTIPYDAYPPNLGNIETITLVNCNHIQQIDNSVTTLFMALVHCKPDHFRGLSRLTSLKVLSLRYTNFNDISLLQTLGLVRLDLSHTLIKNISGLENQKNLETLKISWTHNMDISGLSASCSLKEFSIGFDEDVSVWVGVDAITVRYKQEETNDFVIEFIYLPANLETLRIFGSTIGSTTTVVTISDTITGPEQFSSFKTLEIRGCMFDTGNAIGLKHLETLEMHDTMISKGLTFLEKCTSLKTLHMHSCDDSQASRAGKYWDLDLLGIPSLSNLETLSVSSIFGTKNLSFLQHFPTIKNLYIFACRPITGDGWRGLGKLQNLETLRISRILDMEGETLHREFKKFYKTALEEIRNLPKLKKLYVGTANKDIVAEWQKEFPDCTIIQGD